ncbi:acetyl-CoA carboxylase biotin carboxyl carrier protein [Clostridium sp. MSJ-11]|uniref:Biotin carboxyl carrier protein of acetyl-CoA carboxylase n=1 Tax=Clostridium mobile TaxID=2841512 RepID=A0ABS6ENL3_9CLOT|nr:acetyl-CoA carboxylase biotin carboxyl carrier protein [Clostridium mobile]MBU5486352.1 acetyl-CoA carboxylase biotin carboxyl carrier protein [Clostridium mobile]
MDFKGIAELIKVVSNSKVTNLEIQENGLSIKITKECERVYVKEFKEESLSTMVEDIKVRDVVEEVQNKIEEKEDDEENIKIICSPIVGTFYSSPSPDKEPFVKVGSKVKKGEVLCIIEAMKLMNEIYSEVDGEVVEIMVEEGSMVEYGGELFKIKY